MKCNSLIDLPGKVRSWYKGEIGLKTDEFGTSFEWRQSDHPEGSLKKIEHHAEITGIHLSISV